MTCFRTGALPLFVVTLLCAAPHASETSLAAAPQAPASPNPTTHGCPASPMSVQILGSAGPKSSPIRASTSYVVWIDGQSKVLVDIGGGAFFRFGESGARLDDLALIALSHLHPDHVSDLPALLWSGTVDQTRREPLAIAGPTGNDAVPGFPVFLKRLFDQDQGAFQVLGGSVGGSSGRSIPLSATTIDAAKREPMPVFSQPGLTVTAIGVPHGNIPSLSYRVQINGKSVVFSSDQAGTDPSFVEFAKGADLLVMHMAIAAGVTNPLHAAPAVVGKVANDAGVKQLVVSHIGLFNVDAAIADVKKAYAGPLTVGADLQCTAVR